MTLDVSIRVEWRLTAVDPRQPAEKSGGDLGVETGEQCNRTEIPPPISALPSLQGYGVLADVVLGPPRGAGPDEVEGLGVLHAVFASEFPVARQEEFLD